MLNFASVLHKKGNETGLVGSEACFVKVLLNKLDYNASISFSVSPITLAIS